MKKTMIVASAILAGVLSSNMVLADGHSGRNAEQIYKECGIGGILFGKSAPIGAIISNVTWDLGTTAASSNVSSPETCVQTEMRAVAFIHNSYDAIMNDSAKGSGTYINTLAQISGKSINELRSTTMQLIADSSYSSQTQMQKASKLYDAVM